MNKRAQTHSVWLEEVRTLLLFAIIFIQLLTASLVFLCDKHGVNAFPSSGWLPSFYVLLLIISIACLAAYIVLLGQEVFGRPGTPVFKLLFIAVVLGSLSRVVMVSMLPISSWDGLGLWTEWAARLIEWFNAIDPNEFHNREHPRHPRFIIFVHAVQGYLSQEYGIASLTWLNTSLVFLAVIFFACELAILLAGLSEGILVAFLTMTVPLTENHTLLVGYAELWLSAGVLLTAVGISRFYIYKSAINYPLICCGAILLISTKNIGLIYIGGFVLAFTLYAILGKSSLRAHIAIGTAFSIMVFFRLLSGTESHFGDFVFFKIVDTPSPRSGHATEVMELAVNNRRIFFENQSFYCLGLIGVLACAVKTRTDDQVRGDMEFFLFGAVGFSISVFLGIQFFQEYSYIYARTTSDLGATRFLIPCMTLLLPLSLARLSNVVRELGQLPAYR